MSLLGIALVFLIVAAGLRRILDGLLEGAGGLIIGIALLVMVLSLFSALLTSRH
jgi:hypothetical protein